MHFETIKRDEILPMISQAKNKKEQKAILCDLLDCTDEELEALIKELRREREVTAKVAHDDELAEIAAYAKKVEGEIKDRDAEIERLKKLIENNNDEADRQIAELGKAAAERELAMEKDLRAAQDEVETLKTEVKASEEKLMRSRSLLFKSDTKQMFLREALARSIEFISALNQIMAEVLK